LSTAVAEERAARITADIAEAAARVAADAALGVRISAAASTSATPDALARIWFGR
jgi:hypothetical protein